MLLHELHASVGRPDHLVGASARQLMVEHHKIYSELEGGAIADLASRAGLFALEKASAQLTDASKVLATIREERAITRSTSPGMPNTVEASRHDDHWIARFLELYASMGYPSGSWKLHAPRSCPPVVPDVTDQKAINERIKLLDLRGAQHVKPWWLGVLCKNRDEFSTCALYFKNPDEEDPTYDSVLFPHYVCQQPEHAFFIEARRFTADDDVSGLADAFSLSSNRTDFEMIWQMSGARLGRSHESVAREFGDRAVMYVVPHVVFTGRYACTRAAGIPFDEFTLRMATTRPRGEPKESTARVVIPSSIRAMILDEYPWFTHADVDAAFREVANHSGGGGGHSANVKPPTEPVAPAEPLSEADALAALDELRDHRELWRWDLADIHVYFYVFDRGVKGTKADEGVASDCVATLA